MTQNCAQLYLADQRGCSQTDGFRSFHTFNFGQFFDENRYPIGSLHVLNDDTLRGGYSIKMHIDEPTEVLIIPLVGGIEYKDSYGNQPFIEAGEIFTVSAHQGLEYELFNPYEGEELVNFLQIWLKDNSPLCSYKRRQTTFNLNQKNQLLPLFSEYVGNDVDKRGIYQKNYAFIGKFEGRQEGFYTPKNNSAGIFVFIIEGVFEVANRLLNSRDSISLWDVENIAFEALSNDTIIVLMEIKGNKK